jgi:pimeloyl-ACP methyl ester carboxylesterase
MEKLLLLHGLNEWSGMWKAMQPFLEPNVHIKTLNFPGFGGKTGPLCNAYGPAEMARWLIGQDWFLAEEKWHVAGHSMGGYVAFELLGLCPDKLQSVFAINSTAEADDAQRKHNRNRTIALLQQKPAVYFKEFEQLLFASLPKETSSVVLEEFRNHWASIDRDFLVSVLLGLRDRPSYWEVLAATKVPWHFFQGNQDPLIDLSMFYERMRPWSNRCHRFPGGHLLPLERPKELSESIIQQMGQSAHGAAR